MNTPIHSIVSGRPLLKRRINSKPAIALSDKNATKTAVTDVINGHYTIFHSFKQDPRLLKEVGDLSVYLT